MSKAAPAAAAAKPAAAKPAAKFSGEIMKASEVNDDNVKAHIANKKDVNKMVASGHAPNVEKYGPQQPILWWACYGDHKLAVELLLKAGAKKDFKAKDGSTCLMIAEHKENDDIVKLLGGTVKPKEAPKPESHEHKEKAHPHRDLEKEKKMHEEAQKKKAAEEAAAAKAGGNNKPAATTSPAKPAAAAAASKPATTAAPAAKPTAGGKKA
jgi:ankyrin repeat protein